MSEVQVVEPWLRGTLGEVDAVRRQVLHALDLAGEDADRWCAPLTPDQRERRPWGIASVGYHLRHIARSLDRLLTYAEGGALSPEQHGALGSEMQPAGDAVEELHAGLAAARARVLAFESATFAEARGVGRDLLPSTVGGLLVHCAEHTQRHIGQAITTAQVVARQAAGQ